MFADCKDKARASHQPGWASGMWLAGPTLFVVPRLEATHHTDTLHYFFILTTSFEPCWGSIFTPIFPLLPYWEPNVFSWHSSDSWESKQNWNPWKKHLHQRVCWSSGKTRQEVCPLGSLWHPRECKRQSPPQLAQDCPDTTRVTSDSHYFPAGCPVRSFLSLLAFLSSSGPPPDLRAW